MGQTGFAERRRAAENSDAPRVAQAEKVDLSELTRAALDDLAKGKGLDTTGLPNKPAVIAAIVAGKLPE